MQQRQGINAGHIIGLLIGICVILILIGFFKLTWGFWSDILGMANMNDIANLFKSP